MRAKPFPTFQHPDYNPENMARSSQEVFDKFKDYEKAASEFFLVVYLNPKNAVLATHYIRGTADSAIVAPREVFTPALMNGATSIIFAHNHPSGDPDPSACDREITKDLCRGAKYLGLKVLDHVVIGKDKYFSFADNGLIEDYGLLAMAPR
jgi:DNA repair protein RadC